MKLPPEFFENRVEQAKIKEAVGKAIPGKVFYHNLIIAFVEMLARFTQQAFEEEVFSKSTRLINEELSIKINLCETLINLVEGERIPFAGDDRAASYNDGISRAVILIRRYQTAERARKVNKYGKCGKCGKEAVHLCLGTPEFQGDQDDDNGDLSIYFGEEPPNLDVDVVIFAHICFECGGVQDVGIESPRELKMDN